MMGSDGQPGLANGIKKEKKNVVFEGGIRRRQRSRTGKNTLEDARRDI